MSVKEKIKQYGFKNSLWRGFKSLLRLIGIRYESFYLMVNHIDIDEVEIKMKKYDYSDVKVLALDDFMKGDNSVFTNSKMDLIKKRFENGRFYAFGILDNDRLIYSTWISFHQINFGSNMKTTLALKPYQAVLEDSYCHPDYRGKMLHSKMNLYRLQKIFNMNFKEAIAIVVKENTPAFRTQLNSGFSIVGVVSVLTVFNKQFKFEKNRHGKTI